MAARKYDQLLRAEAPGAHWAQRALAEPGIGWPRFTESSSPHFELPLASVIACASLGCATLPAGS
jgi:hypothetical protein